MTALKKYRKLESSGLWRDGPEAQRREVVVNLGAASLILTDPRTDTALAHWSLPAVERRNPGQSPAVYIPAADAPETLELDDPDMIAALETVRGALAQARPRPGRLRGALMGGAVVAVAALVWIGGLGSLASRTAAVVPPGARAEIGRLALDDLIRFTGQPCTQPGGLRALETLAARLPGVEGMRLVVLRDSIAESASLPGGIIVLSRRLVEDQDGPEALAGFALAQALADAALDPLVPLLEHAGLRATFGLLTSAALPADAIEGYGEVVTRRPGPRPDEAALLDRFRAAGVPSSPYAYARDPTGETVLPLIEGDPFRGRTPEPLLSDGDWLALQAVCAD